MFPSPKRPPSVWIAQILLGIYALGTVLIVLWGLYRGLTEGIPNPEQYVISTVGILSFAAVFFGGLWGMALRRNWGRWLGVAGLTILLIAGGITQTSRTLSGTDSSPSYIGLIFSLLFVVGLAFLTYKVAAGDAADRFFSVRPSDSAGRNSEDTGASG